MPVKEGPYEVSSRSDNSGVTNAGQLWWYIKGPGHDYYGGYLNSYANLAPLIDDPTDPNKNCPPPEWVKNVCQLMNEAYAHGGANARHEIRAALGLEKTR